jgi:Sulfotransferase domain
VTAPDSPTALQVVGAGLGRTGTHSLKVALERLTGRPCYHMSELIQRQPDTAVWQAAVRGQMPDWGGFLAGFGAAVDWPASAFWAPIAAAAPGALVLLSTRADADTWWRSFEATIASSLSRPVPADRPDWAERRRMTLDLLATTFTPDWAQRDAAVAAYAAHNAAVRAAVPGERLVDWRPGDGWEPLCRALGTDVPDEPFPETNSTAEFRASETDADESG